MPTISSMADVDKRSTSLRRAASSAGDDRGDGEQDRRAGAAKQPDAGLGRGCRAQATDSEQAIHLRYRVSYRSTPESRR